MLGLTTTFQLPLPTATITLADAWLHQLDPFALRFSGNFGIRWYGLSYALGFVVAFVLARMLAKRKLIGMTPQQVGDFIIASIFGVMIGGRLGWVIFYNPSALWTFTDSLPYWEVLAINRGGMASHGGMIGVILAMIWFGRRHRLSPFEMLDLTALLFPFGALFVRSANFINGELRGNACSNDYPLAVKFPQEIAEEWDPNMVIKAIDAADAIGLTRRDWMLIAEGTKLGDPEATAQFEFIRDRLVQLVQMGNEEVIQVVTPLLIPRYPSQLFQAAAEGLLLGAILWTLWWFVFRRGRFKGQPGFTGVFFLIIYGFLRIVTEVWRQPDIGIGRTFGLSRGQWLSIAMIAGASMVLAYLIRRLRRSIRAGVDSGATVVDD